MAELFMVQVVFMLYTCPSSSTTVAQKVYTILFVLTSQEFVKKYLLRAIHHQEESRQVTCECELISLCSRADRLTF
jgi:hypothetical protein